MMSDRLVQRRVASGEVLAGIEVTGGWGGGEGWRGGGGGEYTQSYTVTT